MPSTRDHYANLGRFMRFLDMNFIHSTDKYLVRNASLIYSAVNI